MAKDYSITKWFGTNLAKLLSEKIVVVYPEFDTVGYQKTISRKARGLSYTERVVLHAETLREFLPEDYKKAVGILVAILGEENPNETGMFKNYYWVLPIGKFIEKYGLDDYAVSIEAIGEVTKRNTGEYAIRPYLRQYPERTIKIMEKWSKSDNFHLRRLASEGARPKLPWATKLDTFVEKPDPVFTILANLMTDDVKFVQKSVANNLRDYLKVNEKAARAFMKKYQNYKNKNTKWILKHATRK